MELKHKHLVVLSSPSGGGKTTIAKFLLEKYKQLKFSISATTRKIRHGEVHGKDYFFLSVLEFEKKISKSELVEYEMIFNNYYGTLKSEINNALTNNEFLLFDVDVKGALSIKRAYPDDTALIFIAPPSFELLEMRLRSRSTETDEQIKLRLERAKMELEMKNNFDYIIINDILENALNADRKSVV